MEAPEAVRLSASVRLWHEMNGAAISQSAHLANAGHTWSVVPWSPQLGTNVFG
jgi:hypothetical protein